MFTVTRSLVSAVVTLVPRSTEPPLPATVSVLSAMVRTGFVTTVVGVVGVVGAVGVVGVVGVVDVLVSVCRPENVFTAPERLAARPEVSLMLAPLGRLTLVIAR